MVECMKRGWKVSVPVGEDCRYDVIVDTKRGLSRVQVKAFSPDRSGVHRFKPVYGRAKKKPYTQKDCDIIAAYAINLETWWIIPVKRLPTTKLNLSTSYHKYNSAWHLIGNENKYTTRK